MHLLQQLKRNHHHKFVLEERCKACACLYVYSSLFDTIRCHGCNNILARNVGGYSNAKRYVRENR